MICVCNWEIKKRKGGEEREEREEGNREKKIRE